MSTQRLNDGYFSSPMVVEVAANFTGITWGSLSSTYTSALAANLGETSLKVAKRATGVFDVFGFDNYANFLGCQPSIQTINATTPPSVIATGTFWTPYSSAASANSPGSTPGGTLTVFTGLSSNPATATNPATNEQLQIVLVFNDSIVP